MKINIEDYKPIINTKDLPDHVIELWFDGGKAGLTFVRELVKIDIIYTNQNFDSNYIHYYDKDKKWLIYYKKKEKILVISYLRVWKKLEEDFNLNEEQIKEMITKISKKLFNFELITTQL